MFKLYIFNDIVAVPGTIVETDVTDGSIKVIADDLELAKPSTSLQIRRTAKGPPSLNNHN